MATPEKAQSNTNSMQRVKVYCLNEDGKWDDRGTGHISMDYMEHSEDLGLHVIDEDDNETLLIHRISPQDIYRKQEDTIISWREPERSMELALSFQETAGCSHVWNQISTTQRNQHFNSFKSTFQNVNSDLRELPVVDTSNIPQILKIFSTTDQTRLTGLLLKDLSFFEHLMKTFEACEINKDVDCLHMMFNIVKGIISLNSPPILEKIFEDELIMNIIGCLEYDPDLPQPQHHRTNLREHVVFKEVIPIKNPSVLSKIHQTYRIGYLKDVVLTRVLDDATAASLNSIINANKATVVTLLKDDSTFFQELFARLRSPSASVESKNDLVHFLHEFCSISKSLQMAPLLRLFRDLINEGIFDIIAEVLQFPDKQLVSTGTDILLIFLTPDPNLLRSYLVRPEAPLLGLLVNGLMEDFSDKMLDIFRLLLDSNALTGGAQVSLPLPRFSDKQKEMRPNIMDIFCEKHLPELVDFITASCPERPGDTSESASRRVGRLREETTKKVLLNICELLSFCVQQDPSRAIFFLQNATEKVLFLTRRKEKPVVAAAIRFFRSLLTVHDDNVQSHVVKNNLLKPIIDVLVAGANQDNLVTSAILEFLEHIRKVSIFHSFLNLFLKGLLPYILQFYAQADTTVLLKHVVATFWEQLAPFVHLTSIQALKMKHEQCLKSWGPKSTTDPAASYAPSRSGGLVDYEDDEDDEDDENNKTLPQKQPEASADKREEELRLKSRTRGRDDEQEQCNKKTKLCSTNEGNKNSPEQGGGEAKQPENCRSSDDNIDCLDEEKETKLGTGDDGSVLTPSESSTEMDVNGSRDIKI